MLLSLNKKIKESLSFRLAFFYSLSFAIFLSLAFFFTYIQIKYKLEQTDREIISSKMNEIASVLQASEIKGLGNYLASENKRILNSSFLIRVVTKEGEPLFVKPAVQEQKFDFEESFKKNNTVKPLDGWYRFNAIDDEDVLDVLVQKVSENYLIEIGKSSDSREDVLDKISFIFLFINITFIILSSFIGFWYAKKSLSPIRKLITAIKSIEAGDFTKRVTVGSSKDELRDLTEVFNGMIQKIEKLISMMKESLDNVAHDIRTPLTRIRFIAEDAILKNDPQGAVLALAECSEGSSEISLLVEQLMSISEAEVGTLKLQIEENDLNILISEVIDIYEFVATEKKIKIFYKQEDKILCFVDKKRIKQVVGNLLDNAIKFSMNETSIHIDVSLEGNEIKIAIQDEGAGISADHIERVWDRLYRADSSRSTQGMGLGLSIVKSIIFAHKGRVEVISKLNEGSIFYIFLKK